MDGAIIAGLLPILVWAAFIVIIIYLIVKRIEDKKKETFEDRDN